MAAEKPEPLIDNVYAQLRDLILSNALRAGQKLVDRDLAEKLGVSRTPVREALGRLAMMGLVEARNRRGYYVRQYSADEVTDLYEFRKILEVNAARLAAENLQPEHERAFDRILEDIEEMGSSPANRVRPIELDIEIHRLIAKACGNEELNKAIRNLMDKVICFIWVDWLDPTSADPKVVAATNREHEELIFSIKDHDGDRAAEQLGAHVDQARDKVTDLLQAREELRDAVLSGVAPR
jgi:DNA-binding GntR family transcriptional regulator